MKKNIILFIAAMLFNSSTVLGLGRAQDPQIIRQQEALEQQSRVIEQQRMDMAEQKREVAALLVMIQNLDKQVEQLGQRDVRLDTLGQQVEGHAQQLGNLKRQYQAHSARLDEQRIRMDQQRQEHTGQLNQHAGRLGALINQDKAHTDQLVQHENQLGALTKQGKEHTGQLNQHAGRLGALTNQDKAHTGQLNQHAGQLGTLMQQGQAHEGQLNTLTKQGQAQGDQLVQHTDQLGTLGQQGQAHGDQLVQHTDQLGALTNQGQEHAGQLNLLEDTSQKHTNQLLDHIDSDSSENEQVKEGDTLSLQNENQVQPTNNSIEQKKQSASLQDPQLDTAVENQSLVIGNGTIPSNLSYDELKSPSLEPVDLSKSNVAQNSEKHESQDNNISNNNLSHIQSERDPSSFLGAGYNMNASSEPHTLLSNNSPLLIRRAKSLENLYQSQNDDHNSANTSALMIGQQDQLLQKDQSDQNSKQLANLDQNEQDKAHGDQLGQHAGQLDALTNQDKAHTDQLDQHTNQLDTLDQQRQEHTGQLNALTNQGQEHEDQVSQYGDNINALSQQGQAHTDQLDQHTNQLDTLDQQSKAHTGQLGQYEDNINALSQQRKENTEQQILKEVSNVSPTQLQQDAHQLDQNAVVQDGGTHDDNINESFEHQLHNSSHGEMEGVSSKHIKNNDISTDLTQQEQSQLLQLQDSNSKSQEANASQTEQVDEVQHNDRFGQWNDLIPSTKSKTHDTKPDLWDHLIPKHNPSKPVSSAPNKIKETPTIQERKLETNVDLDDFTSVTTKHENSNSKDNEESFNIALKNPAIQKQQQKSDAFQVVGKRNKPVAASSIVSASDALLTVSASDELIAQLNALKKLNNDVVNATERAALVKIIDKIQKLADTTNTSVKKTNLTSDQSAITKRKTFNKRIEDISKFLNENQEKINNSSEQQKENTDQERQTLSRRQKKKLKKRAKKKIGSVASKEPSKQGVNSSADEDSLDYDAMQKELQNEKKNEEKSGFLNNLFRSLFKNRVKG